MSNPERVMPGLMLIRIPVFVSRALAVCPKHQIISSDNAALGDEQAILQEFVIAIG